MKKTYIFITTMLIVSNLAFSQKKKAVAAPVPDKLELLKQEVIKKIDDRQKFTQEVNDQIFSFGELGFQEYETSKYLTNLLEKKRFHR